MIDEVEKNSLRGNRELEGVEYFQDEIIICMYIFIF